MAFAGNYENSDILDYHEIMGRLVNIIKDTKVFLDRNVTLDRLIATLVVVLFGTVYSYILSRNLAVIEQS